MIAEKKQASVLIVDDESFVREIVARWLEAEGYSCDQADGGLEALEALASQDFTLVISDIMMPGISGVELLREAHERYPHTPFIMLTGLDDRETATEALKIGAYGYILKPLDKNEILINVEGALHRRDLELLRDRYEFQLEETVQRRTKELQAVQDVTIYGLAVLAEYRDKETGGHIMRTKRYVKILAEYLAAHTRYEKELSPAMINLFYKSAPIHDIGKVGVPDSILLKPGKLTDQEWREMKSHTIYGRNVIIRAEKLLQGDKDASFLRVAREITATHHEKWDGSGYPAGLHGEEIPLVGRLMAIADVYDALISRRVYKKPFSHSRAVEIITQGDGRVMPNHFDPEALKAFMNLQGDFRQIANEYADHDDENVEFFRR